MTSVRFRPSPAVRASISGDGLVLLDVNGGVVLASNPIGAHIWQLMAQRRTGVEIARQLAIDYGVSIDRAHDDVGTFIRALAARGLVIEEPPC
jgi:hypothetical protein